MGKPASGGNLKWAGTRGNDTATVASLDEFSRTSYDAGAGYDTLNLSHLSSGVSVDIVIGTGTDHSHIWPYALTGSWWDYSDRQLAGHTRFDDTLKNFEKIVGTNFNDYLELRGGSVARVVDGGGGDDAIYVAGSSGTNTAIGGAGSDQLFGSHSADILVGGDYSNNVVARDDVRDEFEAYAGTILDFTAGVDALYIDAASLPGGTTTAAWQDVMTSYGAAARLTMAPDRVITVVGVTAETMNALPKGFVLPANGGDLSSGSGDDFIWDNSTITVDRFKFAPGSGHDELMGYDVGVDKLLLPDVPTYSAADYHGQASLLVTFDGGHSSVLLIGITDQSQVTVENLFGP
jgi:Ca2+-binding RTX toxin-like protein